MKLTPRTFSKLLLIFAICARAATIYSTTVSTPASSAVYALRWALLRNISAGQDVADITMNEVMQRLDVEVVNSMAQGKFAERFELLGHKVALDPTSKERLIAVTSNQISEDSRDSLGRYVIWFKDGTFRISWESETRMAALMSSNGLTLVNKGVWAQPDTKESSLFHVKADGQTPSQVEPRLTEKFVEQSPAGHMPSVPDNIPGRTEKMGALRGNYWWAMIVLLAGATLYYLFYKRRKGRVR